MPDISILTTLAPYHIITYGTLLGSSIFQSFIAGPVAFTSLPRAQFATLQATIFPIYFSLQSALPILLALTYPGHRSPSSSSSPFNQKAAAATKSSVGGFFAGENYWTTLLPIATCFAATVVNLVWAGPKTNEIMRLRKHQETRDGKKAYDPPPHSQKMQQMNKSFARMHGISASLNLVALAGTVVYGFVLAERLQ